MSKLNLDYYEPSTNDVYSDGDIENDLLAYAKSGDNDWYSDGRWPVVYHMSHLRHNILNWFPFKENSSILEIGAGCGALTGLLCERAERVVAVELTKRRAEVNFQRHKHFDNLEIVVCDFQNIPQDWKFDYIIINGVLEYSAYMVKSNQPYKDFLRISANHLEPKGRILLAIENRLGLKYFSGAKEDHTGKYFSGVNGYVDGENVKTFSKEELSREIRKAQLHPLKFYYPFPDYKFPSEIFTDETVNNITPSVPNYPLDMSRTRLFDENAVYKSFMDSGIMDKFANSFLVEIALDPDEVPAEMAYVKLSTNRNEKFRIYTYFDSNREKVYKKALTLQAEDHFLNMERFSGFKYHYEQLKNTICYKEIKGLSFRYIKGESLEDRLLAALNNRDVNGFVSLIKHFRDALFADILLQVQPDSSMFREIFGKKRCQQKLRWTTNANVDMISGNIFIEDESFQVIDYEWHLPCEVPQEFVFWRMLKQFIDDNPLGIYPTNWPYNLIDIDKQTEECFIEWEYHFAKDYVGITDLYDLAQDVIQVDIEQAASHQIKDRLLQSTLFYDLGDGYTDMNYERHNAVYSPNGFSVTFTQEKLKKAKMLRWDPLEGSACCIKIQDIETDGNVKNITAINAERYNEDIGYEFFTFDPQLQIDGDFEDASYLKISFSCTILDWTQGYRKREEELNLCRQKNEEHLFINQRLQSDIEEIRNISDRAQAQLEESLIQIEELKKAMKNTQDELTYKQSELNQILNQMKEHRIKTSAKVLLFGGLSRGKSSE